MANKGDAKDAVLKYLKLQNRPYSANDITQNLHKEFGKTAIQKALDELASSNAIKEKVYGKQKVYAPIQEEAGNEPMDNVLKELDKNITEASNNLTKAEEELKTLENELKTYTNEITTEAASTLKTELTSEISNLETKLDNLTQNKVKISSDDKIKISKEKEKVVTEYRKRKRICMDMANTILENYPKTKKQFYEEVGIETDEDVSR